MSIRRCTLKKGGMGMGLLAILFLVAIFIVILHSLSAYHLMFNDDESANFKSRVLFFVAIFTLWDLMYVIWLFFCKNNAIKSSQPAVIIISIALFALSVIVNSFIRLSFIQGLASKAETIKQEAKNKNTP
jgi:hypothetical protein